MSKKSLLTIAAPALAALGAIVALAAGGPAATAATSAATASASCSTSKLALHTPGVLTSRTDAPAYPPYFENNKPATARASRAPSPTRSPSSSGSGRARSSGWSSRSTPRTRLAQRASTSTSTRSRSRPQRAKEVSFSTPYYTNPQAIIVYKNSPLAHAKSLAAFKNANIGRSDRHHQPERGRAGDQAVQAAPDLRHVQRRHQAFKIHRVDAIVVDYATALYLTSAELSKTTIAGQFIAPGGDNWGLLLKKGSTLTPCVNKALAKLKSNGTLANLTKRWMSSKVAVPVLK